MLWTDSSTVVYVPGGSFVMGQDEKEPSDHSPAHTVTLSPFWIYQAEVTNRMYQKCVELGACTAPTQSLWYTDPKYENAPVSGVDWNQAKAYCEWMNGRLPTEAEWELAARGTQADPYPWGKDEPTCDLLNFLDCLVPSVPDTVRSYPSGTSPYNAADMAGNVSEWVSDWYAKDYYSTSPASDPTGPVAGKERVVRGSSYSSPLEELNITLRSPLNPLQSQPEVGFRCVLNGEGNPLPLCKVLSYEPIWDPMVPPPTGSPSIGEGKRELFVSCPGGGQEYGTGTLHFPGWDFYDPSLEAGSYDINSPQGEVLCNHDFLSHMLFCTGSAFQPSTVVTVTVCVKSEEQLSPQAEYCPSDWYRFDPDSNLCVYLPQPGGMDDQDCIANGGVPVRGYDCLPKPGNDQCPVGYYRATYYGQPVCVPVSGPVDSEWVSTGATCPTGLVFNEGNLCCDYPPDVAPACPIGYTFHPEVHWCVSDATPNCVTVSASTTCEPTPEQQTNCPSYTDLGACRAAGCTWVVSAGPGSCK